MLISETYRQLNRQLHALGSYGRKGDKWAQHVQSLIERFNPQTILDYGCGQGALGRALDRPIMEYDPAVPGKEATPNPADLVVCTDVLEHIEPVCLEAVLNDLRRVTNLRLFAVVSTKPAKKLLADGRNAHLIVEQWEFWERHFSERFHVEEYRIHNKEVEVLLSAT